MVVIEVKSKEEFDGLIKSEKTSVVDFFAEWCGPCKMISPKFKDFSSKFEKIQFIKVDVDQLKEVSRDCGIRAMPTFQIYKNGEKIKELVGANPEKLEEMIEAHNK